MAEHTTPHPALPQTYAALLRRVARALAHGTDGAAFVQVTVNNLVEVLGLPWTGVLLISRDGDELQVCTASPMPSPLDRLALHATPEVNDVLTELRTALLGRPFGELAQLLPIETEQALAVPLIAQGRALGTLVCAAPPGRPFAEDAVALTELVGDAIAASVYLTHLAEAMSRRNEQFVMVADIAAQVSSSLEPREVYRLVVQKLSQYFHVEAGSLLLKDEATDELIFVMTIEGGEEKLHGARIPPGRGIAGHVARSQQFYISNDAANDPLRYTRFDEQAGFSFYNLICVPMVVKDRTIGVIELINKIDGSFNDKDAQRLLAIASVIGVAIENARLFEFVRQRRDRLEALIDSLREGLPQDRVLELLTRELQVQDSVLVAKFNNPYIVGQPVLKPEMFFGRDGLMKRILSVLHHNSLVLYGERRIGKTSTLRQLQLRLHGANDQEYRFLPIYIDLQGINEEQFFQAMMEEVIHSFGARADSLPLSYAADLPRYTGREFHRDLRTVVTALAGPQPDGRIHRLVLLIDEADVMYGFDEQLLQEFRRVFMSRYAAYLSVVFAAVQVQRVWRRYESPLYNLFKPIEVPPLTRADAELLIRTPVRGRYDYQEPAVDLIYQISDGRPIRIQHICMEAIDYVREQGRTLVTEDDVRRIGEALKERDTWL